MHLVWRITRALFAFSVVAIAVLIFEGHRKDAGEVLVTTEIHASPEQLWPWLDEGERAKKWIDGLTSVRAVDSTPGPIGRKEIWTMGDVSVTGTCTEYVKPTRLSAHLSAPGSFEGDQSYLLVDLGDGRTRLEVTGRFRYVGWLPRLMEPFITHFAQRQMERDITHLELLMLANGSTPRN